MDLAYSTHGKCEDCIQNCCRKPDATTNVCKEDASINQTQYIEFLSVCVNRLGLYKNHYGHCPLFKVHFTQALAVSMELALFSHLQASFLIGRFFLSLFTLLLVGSFWISRKPDYCENDGPVV